MEPEIYRMMSELEANHWWFVARRKIISTVLARLTLQPNARIFEAGSGTGGNLGMLSKFGRVTGLEPSPLARSFSQERKGGECEIVDGSLPGNVPFDDATFDLVTALDVLEHLEDDAGALLDLHRVLKPGGFLVVTVPAFPALWGPHDVSHHHKRRYRRGQMLSLVDEAGFATRHATYFNSLLFVPAATVRLTKRVFHRDTPDARTVPPRPLNSFLQHLFSFESHFVPRWQLPFGLSLLVVGQRPVKHSVR